MEQGEKDREGEKAAVSVMALVCGYQGCLWPEVASRRSEGVDLCEGFGGQVGGGGWEMIAV